MRPEIVCDTVFGSAASLTTRDLGGINWVAVGTDLTTRPPHRSVRAALPHTAPTSDNWRRIAPTHTDQPVGHICSPSVWGTCGAGPCSPWLASFPPPTPQLRFSPLLCSQGSSVLRHHPTPHRRACQHYGVCLLRPDWSLASQSTMRSPGSRACSFSTCMGSSTTRDRATD
jgi:hypothetical protein